MRIPEPVRGLLKRIARPWLRYRDSRERSVKNIARANDRQAFETIYGSPDLVGEYLAPERLEFYARVADLCAELRPRTVLDVGCGTGELLAAIVSRLPNIERAVGIDYSAAAIARLAERLPSAEGIVADLYQLGDLGERFELVVCTEVLEHVHRPKEAIDALVERCAVGGRVVVTVPDGEVDTYEGHVNFWSLEEFENLIADAGEVETTRLDADVLVGVINPSGDQAPVG